MSTLQEGQPEYDRAVCDAMVASTPGTWSVIVLELERPSGAGIGDLIHSLSSPEGLSPVQPDDSLYLRSTTCYLGDESSRPIVLPPRQARRSALRCGLAQRRLPKLPG